jgi:hypothetical protein
VSTTWIVRLSFARKDVVAKKSWDDNGAERIIRIPVLARGEETVEVEAADRSAAWDAVAVLKLGTRPGLVSIQVDAA